MAMKIKLRMNLKLKLVSQALSPQLKKRIPKQMSSPQKNVVGDQVALSANLRRSRGTKQGATTEEATHSKVTKATGQKTKDPELEHDKSQAAMGSRNGEVKFEIQP